MAVETKDAGAEDSEPKDPSRSHPKRPKDTPSSPVEEDPWSIDEQPSPPGDCDCPPDPRPPSQRPSPPETTPKSDDCCRQIIEAIKCIPGVDPDCLKMRKPKVPPKLKITNLCGVLPIKERVAPVLLLILRRYRASVTPGNKFEKNMFKFLDALPAKRLDALLAGLDGYDALPAMRRDCVFETRFDAWPDEKPLNVDFILRNFASEFIVLGRYFRYGPMPDPFPVAGGARPWEQTFALPGEPGKYGKFVAPWPWICAVSPVGHAAIDETGWYRNESSCVPGNVPRGTINYFAHEFAWNCAPQGAGSAMKCDHVEPGVSSPGGGFGFSVCSGGEDFRVTDKGTAKQACLTVAKVDPGKEVGLRGLNFLSKQATIRIRKVDNPVFRDIPAQPLTDWQPDETTAPGIITCEVRDYAYFNFPATVKDGLNDIPIPPGRYAIQMVVPNLANVAVTAGETPPKEFLSNEILLDLQPNPNQRYQILIDEAGCDEETDGLGSDEAWFRAIAGALELANADTTIQFPVLQRIEVFSADDVDSGEAISFPPASLFNDVLGRKILSIGIIGLEVDSEKAAREQIDAFFDAFTDYFNEALVQIGLASAIGGGGLTGIVQGIAGVGGVSVALWVGGIVFAAIVAGGFIYAGWAPADPIALDSLTFSARDLFDMTDVNPAHVPEPTWNRLHQLRMSSQPSGKTPALGQSAVYTEQRHYVSKWENSRYRLTYRYKRI